MIADEKTRIRTRALLQADVEMCQIRIQRADKRYRGMYERELIDAEARLGILDRAEQRWKEREHQRRYG